jgi:hypothetical protein
MVGATGLVAPENGAISSVVVFPAISAAISLICAGLIARDAVARPRPDKIAWTIAFALFAIAAGAEVMGSLAEWTETLARVYYLSGAILVVGFLALGELYLLAGPKIQRVAPGAAILLTAVSATVVWNAGIDEAKLAEDGWEAIEQGPALTALAIGVNSIGTVIIAGGLIYSAWRFKQLGTHRNRMIGCLLIAIGTITVGLGGTLTRLGRHEYLYIAMAIGVAIIFAGYLQTRRPDATSNQRSAVSEHPPAASRQPAVAAAALPGATAAQSNGANGHLPAQPVLVDSGLAFIETKLLGLAADEMSELCRGWSVSRTEDDALLRDQARRAWVLRERMTPDGQHAFDSLPVSVQRQVTELYYDVMQPQPAKR